MSRGNPNWPKTGNGAGWGGPARGEDAKPMSAENQPPQEAKDAGRAGKAAMRALFEAKRIALAEKLLAIAESDENPALSERAINSIFDRLDGKATVAVSGPEGEALPTSIAIRFVDP